MPRKDIVVGIVCDSRQDTVLICLRGPERSQGGKWEFPGGKLEANETPVQALRRELYEEVDIQVESAHPLVQIEHDYPEASIRLHAWVVDQWSGDARGKEGQTVSWISRSSLDRVPMLPANERIIRTLDLPSLYLITPDQHAYDGKFLKLIEELLRNGLSLLQFRTRQSAFNEHAGLVRELAQLCDSHACRMIYNGNIDHALAVGAHGIHLRSEVLLQTIQRPELAGMLVSASCHDEKEVRHATVLGADFCVIAPVHKTGTHTETRGIGWQGFSYLAGYSRIPVYALGGIKPAELGTARRNGAHGIAMISGVWNAADPVAALRSLTGLAQSASDQTQ